MLFEAFIARRYLSTYRKTFFVSLLSVISLLAVATGVFALIFVLSIMNGFEKDFRQRVLGFKAPLVLMSAPGEDLSAKIAEWKSKDKRIQKVVPFVEGEAVAQTETGDASGVRVRGVSEEPSEKRLGKLYMHDAFEGESLVLGEDLGNTLHVQPYIDEKIRLIFPIGDVSPSGELLPRVRTLKVAGVFHSGYYDFDTKYVLIPYAEALKLFGNEARTGLEIWVDSYDSVEAIKEKLKPDADREGLAIQTWQDQNPKLFAAMKLEKVGMFLLLSILLVIASFNIFGLTSLTVLDKVKDMGVLRALGLSAKKVKRVFLLQAAGLGIFGAFLGGFFGLTVTFLLEIYPLKLPSTYYLETLPIAVDLKSVVIILLLAPLITTLSAYYPAAQASRVSPVDVLRYE